MQAVIAKLAPTDGVEPVFVTDEDEYFPPPRELRELIPALDALAAFVLGGDPAAARARGGPFTDDRDVDASLVLAELADLARARRTGERERVVEALLQLDAELLGHLADLAGAAPAPRGAAGWIGSPTTIATRRKRGMTLPLARISSLPPIATGTTGTEPRREVGGAVEQRADLGPVVARALGEDRHRLAAARAPVARRAGRRGRHCPARPGTRPAR